VGGWRGGRVFILNSVPFGFGRAGGAGAGGAGSGRVSTSVPGASKSTIDSNLLEENFGEDHDIPAL